MVLHRQKHIYNVLQSCLEQKLGLAMQVGVTWVTRLGMAKDKQSSASCKNRLPSRRDCTSPLP